MPHFTTAKLHAQPTTSIPQRSELPPSATWLATEHTVAPGLVTAVIMPLKAKYSIARVPRPFIQRLTLPIAITGFAH